MMRRRQFITLLGATSAFPFSVGAQQPAVPVIGFMSARSPADSVHLLAAFRQGLGDWGFVEGQNVAVEYRWAHGDYHRLPRLAMELVDQRVDRIIAFAAQNRLPAIYQFREYAIAGGLLSYGVSLTEAYRQFGVYAARILKGSKPADLPVQQVVKFELVINLKTAAPANLRALSP